MFRMLSQGMFVLCLLFITTVSFSQNRTVSGKVTDSKDGSSLPNATITLKGTKVATQSAANGSFSISVPPSASTLVVSSVGSATQEVDITNKTSVDISLVITNTVLNDVVVIGYATVRKGDVTSSVSKVTEKEFNKGPFRVLIN